MAKYMYLGNYNAEGTRGVMADGGTKRFEQISRMAETVGATVESMHFAFGDTDVYAIVDAPSTEVAAAVSLAINASGSVSVEVRPLLTPAQVDGVAQIEVADSATRA